MRSSDRSFEHRLAVALHDVETPEGLRGRLLAGLLETPDSVPASGEPTAPRRGRVAGLLRAARPRFAARMSRRSALAWGSLAASAALCGFAWWSSQSGVDPRSDLATLAINWVPRLSGAWKPMGGAPSGFPAWAALTARPRGWQSATSVVGSAAVAYDVSRPRLRAVLFVVRMVAPLIPSSPPPTPFSTGGQAIATWRSGAVVYVLVVEGDDQGYRSLIREVASPLA